MEGAIKLDELYASRAVGGGEVTDARCSTCLSALTDADATLSVEMVRVRVGRVVEGSRGVAVASITLSERLRATAAAVEELEGIGRGDTRSIPTRHARHEIQNA